MKMLALYKDGKQLVPEIENANHFFRRFMGLMYRKSMAKDHGLLLTPCNEIHTIAMRFDIDTIAISKDDKILFIDKSVPPYKVRKKVDGCYKVLELCGGVADELGLKIGDTIELK